MNLGAIANKTVVCGFLATFGISLKLTDFEKVSILLAALAIVAGFGGALGAAYLSNKANRRIAEDSGNFRKPSIELQLFARPSEEGDIWCMLHPHLEGPAAFPLEFAILNGGDAPLENAVLTIKASKHCFPDLKQGGFSFAPIPSFIAPSIQRSLDPIGEFKQLSLTLPVIKPMSANLVNEYFVFTPSIGRLSSITAETKDGPKITADLEVNHNFPIFISLSAPTILPVHMVCEIWCISGTDLMKTVTETIERVTRRKAEKVKRMKFFSKWSHRLTIGNRPRVKMRFFKFEEKNINSQRSILVLNRDGMSEVDIAGNVSLIGKQYQAGVNTDVKILDVRPSII